MWQESVSLSVETQRDASFDCNRKGITPVWSFVVKKVARWWERDRVEGSGASWLGGIIINKHFINPHGDIRGRPLSIAHANYLFQLYMVHRAADPTLLTFIKNNNKKQQQRNLNRPRWIIVGQ